MCTPDFYHAMGLAHPADAQAQAQAQNIGAPVTNAHQPQPSQVAVPANINPAGTGRDTYAYGVAGPGNIPGGPHTMVGDTRSTPAPTAAPPPPNPLDPVQQQNRRQNLARAVGPYVGAAIG